MPQLLLLRQIIANMNILQIKKFCSENAAQHHSLTVVLHARKEIKTMKILLANKEKADPQIAHLQFTQAYAQIQNCKRAIFLPNPQIQYIFEETKKDL